MNYHNDKEIKFLQVLKDSNMSIQQLRTAQEQYLLGTISSENKALCDEMLTLERYTDFTNMKEGIEVWIFAKECLQQFHVVCKVLNTSDHEKSLLQSIITDAHVIGMLEICFDCSVVLSVPFGTRGESNVLSKSPELRALMFMKYFSQYIMKSIIFHEIVHITFYEDVKHFER